MIGDEREPETENTAPEEALGDLDAPDEQTPELAVADSLRAALDTMRDEAARISALETGDEQVQASEQFAEDAGKLDESISSLARADDDARH